MNTFEFITTTSVTSAIDALHENPAQSKIHAGGIDLLGELKHFTIDPDLIVDISAIPELSAITTNQTHTQIGAAVRLTEIQHDKTIQKNHTALADAASVVGSPQIRNVGTIGGNLCQRPRCWYYRDETYPCLRKGGEECYAIAGRNRNHCILGGTPCFIVHPSDCAPALMALNASITLQGKYGIREMALEDFYILPEDDPTVETVLKPGEILTKISIPRHNSQSTYLKFREKDGFDWALSSCAVAMELHGTTCQQARVVLGGVAPKPWRVKEVETFLRGKSITENIAQKAGEIAVEDAEPMEENKFKVHITKAIVKQAILKLVAQ